MVLQILMLLNFINIAKCQSFSASPKRAMYRQHAMVVGKNISPIECSDVTVRCTVAPKTIYPMTGNSCLIYYVTASFVYKRSFTTFRSDAYEEKPRSQDLLHAFFAPNSLFLNKIGHKTLKNHKKKELNVRYRCKRELRT